MVHILVTIQIIEAGPFPRGLMSGKACKTNDQGPQRLTGEGIDEIAVKNSLTYSKNLPTRKTLAR